MKICNFNLFSAVLATTLLIFLTRPNGSYAEIVSQSNTDFSGLYRRLNEKQLSANNLNNTLIYTLGARIAGKLHFL